MEEKKGNTISMNTEKEKMSYEQLEGVAHQLSEQVKQLYTQLQQANLNNMFKRLDYLFKVVEKGEKFSPSFLENCIKEIESFMTIQEDSEDNPE